MYNETLNKGEGYVMKKLSFLLLGFILVLGSCGGTGYTFVVKGAHLIPGSATVLEAGTP